MSRCVLVALATSAARLTAQRPLHIGYRFAADTPASHFGEMTLQVVGDLGDSTLIQLPGWYPGRYAIYNFAANVQEVRARCAADAVPVPQLDKQTWVVRCPATGGERTLEFSFRVWWDDLSGSHSQIDSLHINLNPGTIFPYVVGHKQDAVRVTYTAPAGWRIINGAVGPAPGSVTVYRARYLARAAAAVAQLQASPGRLLMSAQQSSFNAWFFDNVPLWQRTNLGNSAISYYNKGELLAWLLDLEVRARTRGAKTLDDVMRVLWDRFWNGATTTYYLQGHGYGDADVLRALNDVTHSDFGAFFHRYVEGVEELPYEATLAHVGLALVREGSTYRIEPMAAAPEAARRLGSAWLEGR